MEKSGAIAALMIAKLGCCVILPLAAAGALNGFAAWLGETRAVWSSATLILAGGTVIWFRYMRRVQCCLEDQRRQERPPSVLPETSVLTEQRSTPVL